MAQGLHEETLVQSGLDLEVRASLFSIVKRRHPRPERKMSPRRTADRPVEEQQLSQAPQEHWSTQRLALYHSKLLSESARLDEVEASMARINNMCERGLQPEASSFNHFVAMLARHGRLAEAEDWIRRPQAPALYPTLAGLEPGEESCNAVLFGFAELEDLPRTERYATEMMRNQIPIDARSFTALVRACLAAREVRRAHHWASVMVQAGHRKPSKAVMSDLVTALAEVGNAQSANHWLSFMADIRVPLDDTVYELVCHNSPQEIVPAGLSGEGSLRKPLVRPAAVGGRPPPSMDPLPKAESGDAPEVLVLEAHAPTGEMSSPPSPKTPRTPTAACTPRAQKGIPRILVASGGLAMKTMGVKASEWGQPLRADSRKPNSSKMAMKVFEEMAAVPEFR